MRTAQALAALTALSPDSSHMSAELGTKGDAAYLRLESRETPGRWAVVSTPGDRWFSLEVDGGYCLDYFEESTADDEVQTLLARYLDYATQYLSGRGVSVKRNVVGLRELEVSTETETIRLTKSLGRAIRDVIGLRSDR